MGLKPCIELGVGLQRSDNQGTRLGIGIGLVMVQHEVRGTTFEHRR